MAEDSAANSVSVVLVHGGFVDGSGWESVHRILRRDGYNVSVVQKSTLSLADDVAVTKRVLAAQDRKVVLVGHECLNQHWFLSLHDARAKIEAWRQAYNEIRPHGALNWATPVEFARYTSATQRLNDKTKPENSTSERI